MSLYNIVAPTFKPIVIARKSELPEDYILTESAMPSYVLDNRMGTKGYIADGAQNTWFITAPNWVANVTLGPDEVSTGTEGTIIFGKDCVVKPGSAPIRYAGYKIWDNWNHNKGIIRPKFLIWRKSDTLPTTVAKYPTVTLKIPGAIQLDDPRIDVVNICSYKPVFTINIQPTAKFTELELSEFGFYPKYGKTTPCTIEDAVQLTTAGLAIPESILSHVPASGFNKVLGKYTTDASSILKFSPEVLNQFGYPTDICSKFNLTWKSQVSLIIPIADLVGTDIRIREGTVTVVTGATTDVPALKFDKSAITAWPSLPIEGKYDGKTCYICRNTYDTTTFINVNSKKNHDAQLWIMPTQTRSVLPIQQGEDRKKLQKFLTTSVPNPSKYPLQAPNQADPDSISGYVEAYNVLESGSGIFIPAYTKHADFLRKVAGPKLNPRQMFGVFTKQEIESLLGSEQALVELGTAALLTLIFRQDVGQSTKKKAEKILGSKGPTELLKFLGI